MSLEKAVKAVVDAIEHEGPSPDTHQKVMQRHVAEWPILHGALTQLRIEWHKHIAEGLISGKG